MGVIILSITKILPQKIRDWCYDRIALNRYALFGRYEYCVRPSPDSESRYL
jgi:predicted DCC family thiol-disulfide oxidoreductase YuxK